MTKEQKYSITQEQLEQIEHYKRMFELNADLIKNLCAFEKDDIIYGFELGIIYYQLRNCFMEMMNLESEIRNQKL